MKILVTGGGGFLGSAICRQLAALEHQVIAFQRSKPAQLERLGVETRQGDIRHPADVGRATEDCEAVIHTAALAGIWGPAEPYYETNALGTENVVRACRTSGVSCLVHASSPGVVLTGRDIEGGDESLPLVEKPLAPYPGSKLHAEIMVLKANGTALKTVALRPHLMWGPGDRHFLPRLIQRAKTDRLFLPAPEKKNDLVFVANVARAHVQALEELTQQARCAGKAYFVTNNEPQVQGEFVLRLLAAAGVEGRIRKISPLAAKMAGAVMETCWRWLRIEDEPPMTRFLAAQLSSAHWFDCSAARRDFGYVPPISVDQGLDILRNHLSGERGDSQSGSAGQSDNPGQAHR